MRFLPWISLLASLVLAAPFSGAGSSDTEPNDTALNDTGDDTDMSTGNTGNGLDAITTYGSRVTDFSPGDQVPSSSLNSQQDRVIALAAVAGTNTELLTSFFRASFNAADTPAASEGGGAIFDIEVWSNGTAEVVLDTSIDWRDRRVLMLGAVVIEATPPGADLPGGASDDTTDWDLTSPFALQRLFYTQAGQTGSADHPGMFVAAGTYFGASSDDLRLYARSSDGALCMKKVTNVDDEYQITAIIAAGPQQNHY